MLIIDWINNAAEAITGVTVAGTALSTSIIAWIVFWTRMAKLIPTEWNNPFLAIIFRTLNLLCRILGFDWPDIAKIDWKNMRVITKQELTANQVVAAAVVPEAIVENPQPPATLDEDKNDSTI